MDDIPKETELTTQHFSELGKPAETDYSEIQKQIIQESLRILQDSKAVNLAYPNKHPFRVAKGQDPDYEHGSQIRFITLRVPSLFSRDEICVAAVNNISQTNNKSLADPLIQGMKGQHSSQEIAISRFKQSPSDKRRGGGIYYKMTLSSDLKDFTGTSSNKGEAYPFPTKPGVPTFAKRWEDGTAQLSDVGVYIVLGKTLEFEAKDYEEVLASLKKAKIDPNMTEKVTESERKMEYATKS